VAPAASATQTEEHSLARTASSLIESWSAKAPSSSSMEPQSSFSWLPAGDELTLHGNAEEATPAREPTVVWQTTVTEGERTVW
jgi:hypothetical protein